MAVKLRNMSAVVAANDINLTIFKPHWLIENGILLRDEIGPQFVFSPGVVDIATANFGFSAFANRMQQSFPADTRNAGELVARVMKGIVSLLPHTPYAAVGLNFDYISRPDVAQSELGAWTRSVFGSVFADRVVASEDASAMFGTYFSFDLPLFRLKVTCRPADVEPGSPAQMDIPQGERFVSLNFNFHADLTGLVMPGALLERLDAWDSVAAVAEKTANALEVS